MFLPGSATSDPLNHKENAWPDSHSGWYRQSGAGNQHELTTGEPKSKFAACVTPDEVAL